MNKAQLLHGLKKHAPTILTGLGTVGVVATSVFTAKATVKATQVLAQAKEDKGEVLTEKEIFVTAAPLYIPAVLTGAATIACMFGANVLNNKSQAALVSAYALVDSTLKEYKNKVVEVYGKEGKTTIQTELAKDKYDQDYILDAEPDTDDDGKQLFYDELSERYFRATNETVLRAEYELNKMVSEEYGATVNDYFDLIGLPHTDYGDALVWDSSQLSEHYWSDWVHFTHSKFELDDGLEGYIISTTEPLPSE